MTKYLKIPVYEHPDMDYAQFYASAEWNKAGFHVLKDTFGTYLRFGTPSAPLFNKTEWPTAVALLEYKEPEVIQASLEATRSSGISEDTLLKALAIAQDPTLALNLLK